MLQNFMIVLNGVQDDKKLFRKELIKAMAWLNSEERNKLKFWIRERFYSQHANIIDEVLNTKYNFAS